MAYKAPSPKAAAQLAAQSSFSVTPSAIMRKSQKVSNNKNPNTKQAKTKKGGIPSLKQFLSQDKTYRNTSTDLKQNLNNYSATNTFNQNQLNKDFTSLTDRMGKQRALDEQALADDYAARGLLGSGMNVQSGNKLSEDYTNQLTDATLSRDRNLQQLKFDLRDTSALNSQQLADARLNAIRRRAERYGITS